MKRIVFDFGGVLFRWRPAELLKRTLPDHAVDDDRAARWVEAVFQGYGGDWADFDRGQVGPDALAQRMAARTGLAVSQARAVIDAVPEELAPIPASVNLLTRLRAAGQRLHFLSNMPGPYADHLERTHGFVGWFESGVFSSRVGLAKPDRAIFDHAVQRFGAEPADLVFLDDVAENVTAARAAGWQALRFTDAASCEAALRERGWWPAPDPAPAPSAGGA